MASCAFGSRLEASAVLYSAPPDPTRTAADADGRFALLDVGAGPIELWADDEKGTAHVRQAVEVPEDRDPDPVTLVLPARDGSLTVRVRDADGSGVAGAQVVVKSGPPVIDAVAQGRTDAAGDLRLDGLPADVATVQVLPPGSVLAAREVGRNELAGGEVLFRLDAGEISGHALGTDRKPARVRLALDRELGSCIEQGDPVETDAAGLFRFRRLPPGTFELRVVDEEEVLLSMSWFRTGEEGATVWVARADEAALYNVEAHVVDAATEKPVPIEGFTADFSPAAGNAGPHFRQSSSATGGTTEVGRFVSLMPVPPGVYDVTFFARGWRPARMPGLRVPRDGPVPVLRVDRGATVEGRALSADGKPLAGVTIVVGGEQGRQSATTAEDGAFAMTGLEPGEQPASAHGAHVIEDTRTVRAPAVGPDRVEWRLSPAGALEVDLGGLSREGGGERIVVTPLAGGKALETEDDGPLRWGMGRHGAHFDGLVPGRWRVEARQGAVMQPPQEVEVGAGETAVVRVPAPTAK